MFRGHVITLPGEPADSEALGLSKHVCRFVFREVNHVTIDDRVTELAAWETAA